MVQHYLCCAEEWSCLGMSSIGKAIVSLRPALHSAKIVSALLERLLRIKPSPNPDNTVFDIKRLIGRKHSDPSVQKDAKLFTSKVISGTGDKHHVEVTAQTEKKVLSGSEKSSVPPEEVSEP